MSIINVSDKEFEDKVLKSGDLVLCDFWAEWCGPCKQISPILEELSSEYKSKNVTIAKVNIDDNPETPAKIRNNEHTFTLLLLKMENWFQPKSDYNRKMP